MGIMVVVPESVELPGIYGIFQKGKTRICGNGTWKHRWMIYWVAETQVAFGAAFVDATGRKIVLQRKNPLILSFILVIILGYLHTEQYSMS